MLYCFERLQRYIIDIKISLLSSNRSICVFALKPFVSASLKNYICLDDDQTCKCYVLGGWFRKNLTYSMHDGCLSLCFFP